jgi:hypothetical protein
MKTSLQKKVHKKLQLEVTKTEEKEISKYSIHFLANKYMHVLVL